MVSDIESPQVLPTGTIQPATPTPVIPSGRYRKGAVVGWIIGIFVVLVGAYVAAQWYFSDRVPGGATVAGVELGGLSRDDAVATLEAELGAKSRQPIPLYAGEAQTTLDPIAAGITFDAAATVEQMTEFSLNPARLVTHIQGEYGEVPLVIYLAEPQFTTVAQRAAAALAKSPVDGTVVFTDGQAAATAAEAGQAVTPEAIGEVVTHRWLHGDGNLEVEAESITPQITQAATDAALSVARQIAEGPISVAVGGQNFSLPAATVTEATTFHPREGELEPQFNPELLKMAVLEHTTDLLHEPENAYFEFVDGRPAIMGGRNGTELDSELVREAIQTAALSGSRVAEIALVETPPELGVADLEALGVNEVVSEFSTALTANTTRTNNLRRGAELITGVLLLPGDTFSLLDNLNPINAANGFGNAGVIVAGNFTEGMGGGLSQLATTAYNAGFFAGFEDVEHRPHSLFISRYPAGREATLVNAPEGSSNRLDMRFRNNTPHGALIQSWVSGGQIHVAIWSTKYFRVETTQSARSEVVAPIIEERSGPQCVNQSPGPSGFVITNTRQVFRLENDELVINESNRWRYRPTNGIRCVE